MKKSELTAYGTWYKTFSTLTPELTYNGVTLTNVETYRKRKLLIFRS